MADKPLVVVDPHRRRMDEIFSASDLARLHRTVQVVWGRDEPMPLDEARAALSHAVGVVCFSWRYGDALDSAPRLRMPCACLLYGKRGGFIGFGNLARC